MSKKLMYGKAYNSKGDYKAKENDVITRAYNSWHNMLTRCYCPKYQARFPTYIGCSVCEEWLDFQNFAKWFYSHKHSHSDCQLDKDLVFDGNKIYSPDTCCFVPSALNNLLINSGATRGVYPQGVYWDKQRGKYKALIHINGKQKCLGRFECPNEAHQVYKIAKEAYVKEKAIEWQDRIANNVFQALMNWKLS